MHYVFTQAADCCWKQGRVCDAMLVVSAGGADLLSDSQDIDALTSALPKDMLVKVLIEESYEHLDFVWGMDAHILIYPSIKKLLLQFSNSSTPVTLA